MKKDFLKLRDGSAETSSVPEPIGDSERTFSPDKSGRKVLPSADGFVIALRRIKSLLLVL